MSTDEDAHLRPAAREAEFARREGSADERGRRQDARDAMADRRERQADERERLADERDRLADERERAADTREGDVEERARDHAARQRATEARRGAAERREQAAIDREMRVTERLDAVEPPLTRMHRTIQAPRDSVYAALVDADAVARWRVPSGMTAQVHEWDAREGGRVRVSLTYDAPDRVGKTEGRTDTYTGRFVRLVPGELVVEVDEFETGEPGLRGEMTMTFRLSGDGEATELHAEHAGVPEGVDADANEEGWREALDRLAALVERR
jgi:uncharacterized protein YndB with AHSA1/START domain